MQRFRNRGAATSDTRAFCWTWVLAASLFRNERRPTHRHFEFDECPVCGSGHLGSGRVLGTAIPSAPKDQALGQAAAETQTVNAITAARHQICGRVACASACGVDGADALCSFFCFRVAAAFLPAALRFLVVAAFLPAALNFRVFEAFLPAARCFFV
jgi:hypothetical protein